MAARRRKIGSFAFFQSVFSSSAAVTAAEESPFLVQGGDLSIYREFINASDTDSSDIEPVLSVDNGFVSLPASSDLFLLTAAADEEAVPTMTLRKKLIKNPLPKRRLYSSWMIVPYSVVRLW
ncbi:hypothetical protein LINPERPRIM_LOCUS15842 [Linum perenne]